MEKEIFLISTRFDWHTLPHALQANLETATAETETTVGT
jgi:hypothetical protein